MSVTKRLPVFALLALFVISIALGFVVAEHRYKTLSVGNLDYSMFLEFNVRVLDPSLSTHISTNSFADADNMFFRRGPDGAPTMWSWVHLEPIKIIPALLYSLTHSILASFAFYIVMFFLFLLYGAFLVWRHPEHAWFMVSALLSLAVFPSTFLYATGELRAFYILAPMFICFVLSLLYRRPLPEKVGFLIIFILVREEALLLALAALIWELLRNRCHSVPNRETALLWNVWAGWIAVAVVWNLIPGYTFHPPVSVFTLLILFILALCVGVALLWWLWKKGSALWKLAPDVMFGLSAFAPVVLSLIVLGPVPPLLRIIYGRYGILLFYIFVAVLIAYLFDHYRSSLQKKVVTGVVLITIVLSVASELIPHASSTLGYVAKWDASAKDEQLVYRASSTISSSTPVLLDSTTIAAFYAHDNIYAYNYLPYYLYAPEGSESRYPYNVLRLKKLISSQVFPYAVLLNADAEPLLELLTEAGKTTTIVERNNTFTYYRIK